MDLYKVADQIVELLQQRGRLTYRVLKLQFKLDDETLEALKDELLFSHPVVDEDGRGLVWTGDAAQGSTPHAGQNEQPTTEQDRDPASYIPRHLAKKILTSRSALAGERKQVTVMFADIKDSTELIRDLDPEAAQQLLDPAIHIMMDAVHRFEGTVNQVLGDGIMAIFGAPIAHEDHAARACYAALAMQSAMQPYTDAARRNHGIEMLIRVGLNSGEVVVRSIGNDLHMDYSAVGQTTHLAARMEQLARPGSIRFPASTLRLVEGFVRVNDLGTVPVKGMPEPVAVYELTGASTVKRRLQAAVARGLTRFVGRDTEIDALNQARERAASGHGQIVSAVGEAGVGKSRLLYEFIQSHHTQGWRVLESASVSYGKATPYFPVIDLLKRYAHVEESDDSRTIRAKLTGQLLTLDESLQETIAPLLSLLDVLPEDNPFLQLNPQQRHHNTLAALKRMLLRESQVQPLLLVFEDLHWIDSETQALLDVLVDSLPTAQLLLLVNYRPEYSHAWGSKTYYTQLRLDPLTAESAEAFLAVLVGDDPTLAPLKTLLIERTEGNPFFLEESVRTLVETQVLVGQPGAYRLVHDLPTIDVPATVQAILAARIDRLPRDAKRLLQIAAVIGTEVPFSLLQAIADLSNETLYSHLSHLQTAEFLYETALFPAQVYTFKHALTQNVAYQSLLQRTRQQVHRQIAEVLETQVAHVVEHQPELLAHHFVQGEVWEKAFDYLIKAGSKLRQAYASQEAIACYTQALAVSGQIAPDFDAERLLPVYEGRGLSWRMLSKPDEAIDDFQAMLQVARAAGNQRQEGESFCHLARAHNSQLSEDHLIFAARYAEEAMQLAQQTGDPHILARSLTSLGDVHRARGTLQEAEKHYEAAVAVSRQQGFTDVLAQTLSGLSRVAYWQGRFPQALQCCQEGLRFARERHDGPYELDNATSFCLALWSAGDYTRALTVLHEGMEKAKARGSTFHIGRFTNTLGWFHRECGNLTRAVQYNRESTELGRAHHMSNVEISALINLGLDYLALGQHDRALSYLEPTFDRVYCEGFGHHRWRWTTRLLIGLAELAYATGEEGQALRYVEDGLKEAQRTFSQKYIALGRALRGKIIAKRGDTDTAGTDLQQALTLAEQLQSPSLIYPIAYDLGQWNEHSGKEQEAVVLYGKAKVTIAQMAAAMEDEALRSTFLQSSLVQEIHACATRLGGEST